MITIQHTALYYLALHSARNVRYSGNRVAFESEFKHELPFVLLPDGIRAYSGARQMSHFEKTPDGNDVSFMIFPSEETLKKLTKENFKNYVQYKLAANYPSCDIGEESSIEEFDRRNFGHKHYHALRIHMFQDAVLDEILRKELVDVSLRFKNEFTVYHNRSMKINGKELRTQIAEFERLGFIKLAGYVYEATGTLMNREWFETNVYPALCEAYPRDLADSTFKYMRLSLNDVTNARITNHEFNLTDEDKALVPMTLDLDTVLNDMYAWAYAETCRVM